MTACLEIENVCKSFAGEPVRTVLSNVNLTVSPGEFVVITGPSGQGKSTLLSIAGGLLTPDSGTVRLMGSDLNSLDERDINALRTKEVGYIFQRIRAFSALTAYENLVFASKRTLGKNAAKLAMQELEQWGLAEQANQIPSQLSVGQQRRLAIARCMLSAPKLILADEPTNDLDSHWCNQVVKRLAQHAVRPGNAVAMVTHDERYVSEATSLYALEKGGVLTCLRRFRCS